MALTKIAAAGITADSIDETKLADNSIDSEHYNDGSIDNAHLADDAVGVAELSATGTASSSTFLRGDNSWVTPTDTNTVYTHPNHSGDVTSSADGATTIADNAVTLAKMAGGTDGQIITYDASGDPVAVGPGTDGQVLTSTGAGSPPAFETPAAGVGGATGVDFNDDVKSRWGTGNDLEMYHDGNNSVFKHGGTGDLIIQSLRKVYLRPAEGEEGVTANANGSVDLYYDNAKKLETRSDGVGIDGILNMTSHIYLGDSDYLICGAGNDLQIYHDGSNSYIKDAGQGDLAICAEGLQILNAAAGEDIAHFHENGAVELYYDNAKKFETIATGVNVTGGIRLGGNNAANEMDDYEEGTFTPYISTQGGTSDATYNNRGGQYVKIGRLVYITMFIDWTGASNHSGYMYFQDLPFTSAANIGSTPNMHNNYGVGSTIHHNLSLSGDAQPFLFLGAGATGSNLVSNYNNNAAVNEGHDNAGKVYINITYITA